MRRTNQRAYQSTRPATPSDVCCGGSSVPRFAGWATHR